jgi:hypothetical protein
MGKTTEKNGVSSYEAKLYLSLVLHGSSEARKLSMASGVPRTKAYAALKKLTQRPTSSLLLYKVGKRPIRTRKKSRRI